MYRRGSANKLPNISDLGVGLDDLSCNRNFLRFPALRGAANTMRTALFMVSSLQLVLGGTRKWRAVKTQINPMWNASHLQKASHLLGFSFLGDVLTQAEVRFISVCLLLLNYLGKYFPNEIHKTDILIPPVNTCKCFTCVGKLNAVHVHGWVICNNALCKQNRSHL